MICKYKYTRLEFMIIRAIPSTVRPPLNPLELAQSYLVCVSVPRGRPRGGRRPDTQLLMLVITNMISLHRLLSKLVIFSDCVTNSVRFLSFLTTASQMVSTAIDFSVTSSISIDLTMNSISLDCLSSSFIMPAENQRNKEINATIKWYEGWTI